jgi:Flp pilus assembly protein TadG
MKLSKLTRKNIYKSQIFNAQRGVAAVEFALIAPVMILMLFGATEISQAVTVDRKVTQSASTVADLVAQYDNLDCSTLVSIMKISRSVFEPFANQGNLASINVASVALVGGTPKVEWSRMVDSSGNCTTSASLPVGMIVNVPGVDSSGATTNLASSLVNAAGPSGTGGIVLGKVDLNYTSLGTSFFPNTFTMSEQYLLNPRRSTKVCLNGVSTPGC